MFLLSTLNVFKTARVNYYSTLCVPLNRYYSVVADTTTGAIIDNVDVTTENEKEFTPKKEPRQMFVGEVIKISAKKTIKVRVARKKLHPIVKKDIIFHKNFLTHDPHFKCVVGDIVRIDSMWTPASKLKNFIVGKVLVPADRVFDEDTGETITQRKAEPPVMEAGQIKYYG